MVNLQETIASFIDGKTSFEELEVAVRNLISKNPDLLENLLTELSSPSNSQYFTEIQHTRLNQIINGSPDSNYSAQNSDKTQIKNIPTYSDNEKTQLRQDIGNTPENDKTQIKPTLHPSSPDETRIRYNQEDNPEADIHTPATDSDNSQLQTGSTLKGRFVLENILGQGGMGVVYKARDLRKVEANDRNPYVAIKVLNESFKDHPQSLIALQREARKAQTLAHPNIVTVFDFDRDGETVYMTMEYLEGDSLDHIIKHNHPNPLEKEKAVQIIEGICNGLAYAHSHNIIHSDLKPGNIFVTKSGAVKIFDFGIARAMKHTDDTGKATGETTLFDAGSLGGLTPAYASYEMLVGIDPDIRDDIYALACITYELLGGKHPFNKVPANQAKKQNLTPAPIHSINRRQNKGLLHGLSIERDSRTATVLQFQEEVLKERKIGKATIIAASVVVITLLIVSAFPVMQYFKQQNNERIINQLKQADSQTVSKALKELDSVDPDSRDTILNSTKDSLIHYFEQNAEAEIDSNAKKYNYKTALAILDEAKRYYPDSAQLESIISRVENRKNQLLNDLTKRFNALLDKGQLLPRSDQKDILHILSQVAVIDDKHPLLTDPRLPVAYAEQAQRAAQTKNFQQAEALLIAGLGLFPSDTALINIRDAVEEAKSATHATDEELIAKLKQSAEKSLTIPEKQQRISSLLEKPFANRSWSKTLKTYVADMKSSTVSDDPWLTNIQTSIAKLYLDQAVLMRKKERFTEASSLISTAKEYAPTMAELKKEANTIALAKKEYLKTQSEKAKAAKIEGLKQTLLTQAKANDVKAAKENLANLKKLLPANHNFIRIEAPTAIGEAYLRLSKDLSARGKTSSAIQLAKAGLQIAPTMVKLKRALEEYNKSLATSPASAKTERVTSSISTSKDPCKPSFAGYGKRSRATCYDTIQGNEKGPAMIVVPAGGKFKQPYAIGKYEISIADYNIYCRLSGECKPSTSKAAELPVTGITVKQALSYARWLTKTTGYTYRLPKDDEWLYAANAEGQQPEKDFNCRVMLGDTLVKGNALLSIKSGKKNGWGLANYVGNAQEWVYSAPTRISARGGSYQDSLSNCDTSTIRPHTGKADNYTGFRLVRELKLTS